MSEGIVFNIEELTVHDGDGVRVTVFMKGCPLRCSWCHNPEGLKAQPELLYKRVRCAGCGECQKGCEHEDCKPFGRCLHVCPNDCLTVAGERYTPDALAARLNKYKRIFDACGGGVTFSGGEPLIQWEFISEVIDRLDGINVAIETSGYAPRHIFESAVDKLDFIYMDIKLFDSEEHKRHTGCDNTLIKENFLYLRSSGKPFTIRTPLISGITDTPENLDAIGKFIGGANWEKLPENKLAGAKYDMLIS